MLTRAFFFCRQKSEGIADAFKLIGCEVEVEEEDEDEANAGA